MDPFARNDRSYDTDLLILRSLFAIDPLTNQPISSMYVLATDGQGGLSWQDSFTNISSYSGLTSAGVGYLPSTISTATGNINFLLEYSSNTSNALTASIANGGIPGSLIGPQLFSTTTGIRNEAQDDFTSTISGIEGILASGTTGTPQYFGSTVAGLGNTGYISSQQLLSSFTGATSDSFSTLRSTTVGLGTIGYISSASLLSTVSGIYNYTVNYIQIASTVSSLNAVSSSNLTSTFNNLGTAGYVSAATLSTVISGLIRNINVDNAGNLNVYNSQITVSSLQNLGFLSSFHNSSLMYKGINGITMASTTKRDLYFSTANLQFDMHANFITPNTKITVDVFPNFFFCTMNLVNSTQFFPISTMVQYGQNIMLNTTNVSYMVANGFTPGYSNYFQVPLRMNMAGADLYGNNLNPYVLVHRVESCLSSNLSGGFSNSNVSVYMASTNSIFVTMINNLGKN